MTSPIAGLAESAGGAGADRVAPSRAQTGNLANLVEDSFDRARDQSRATGRPVTLRFEVAPDGCISVDAPPMPSALDAARVRGRAHAAAILSGSEMLNSEAFAQAIGTTRETVLRKRERREVLGLPRAVRGWRFPDWQIGADGRPFGALPALHAALGDEPWAVYRFLTTEHGELGGRTGLAMLRAGETDRVLAAASAQARDFA